MAVTPHALITGACGGMGRACARELGRAWSLILADVDEARLVAFAEALREEGYRVAGLSHGDLAEPGAADQLVALARLAGPLRAVVHTAGLSPALAPWDQILRANAVGTERLLWALEAALEPGLAAVLVASMAGHMARPDASLDAVLEAPLAEDFLQRAAALLKSHATPQDPFGLATAAYGQSKRAVIRVGERRAAAWASSAARIVSISPGLIWTPMGRREAETNPNAGALLARVPLGGWGSPLDISAAVAFLTSDAARFITGCDLRIDGGLTPALRGAA
ncbi:MAG: SDR family oxidoreductase [Caulobacteraceae bacterium]|nr:SDR family oxidoreductase [Caulobacteraceae bacterium]